MKFFNRRPVAADADTTTAAGTTAGTAAGTHHEKKPGLFARRGAGGSSKMHHHNGTSAWNSRPTFGQWIKATALDLVTMACMGAIGLGVYMAKPAPSRSFPITFQDGKIVYPQFAYPLRNEIVPIWAAALLAALVPITVFLIVQIRARSFWDVNNATVGVLYSLISAAVFQVFIKWLIGGLRPHFLAVCKPVIPPNFVPSGNNANGFQSIMFDRSICTGDKAEINDALESMPSGHTTAAFAGFVYLYLYLNAKLKVFSNYHPAMWKLIALYAPILGACLIGGALTIDEFHNWYDIAAGAAIGTVFAFSSYRMTYAAIWDHRFNHIPLIRNAPFIYGAGASTFDGFHDAVFTRKAGWGTHDAAAWAGAPGDASDGPRGTIASAGVGAAGTGAAAAAHGAANGRGTHGGVVGAEPSSSAHPHHDHGVGGTRHSVDRKPIGGSRMGENIV